MMDMIRDKDVSPHYRMQAYLAWLEETYPWIQTLSRWFAPAQVFLDHHRRVVRRAMEEGAFCNDDEAAPPANMDPVQLIEHCDGFDGINGTIEFDECQAILNDDDEED
jgi:hypothetical protein